MNREAVVGEVVEKMDVPTPGPMHHPVDEEKWRWMPTPEGMPRDHFQVHRACLSMSVPGDGLGPAGGDNGVGWMPGSGPMAARSCGGRGRPDGRSARRDVTAVASREASAGAEEPHRSRRTQKPAVSAVTGRLAVRPRKRRRCRWR
jgi:hypothetical protein